MKVFVYVRGLYGIWRLPLKVGGIFLTFLVVKPGHVMNWLFTIILIHVEGHGTNIIGA